MRPDYRDRPAPCSGQPEVVWAVFDGAKYSNAPSLSGVPVDNEKLLAMEVTTRQIIAFFVIVELKLQTRWQQNGVSTAFSCDRNW